MNETTINAQESASSAMLDEVFPEIAEQEGLDTAALEAEGNPYEEASARNDRTVPLATFLDMRNEVKARAAENAELRQMIALMQQEGIQPQGPQAPDPTTDPAGYQQYLMMLHQQQLQMEAQQEHQQLSYVEDSLCNARDYLGEHFSEAYETARANPHLAHYVLNHPNPGGVLVQLHHQIQRQKIVDQIPVGVSLEDWIAQQAERLPRQWPGVAPYQTPNIAAPPPSLAGARGGSASAMAPLISDDPIDDILK